MLKQFLREFKCVENHYLRHGDRYEMKYQSIVEAWFENVLQSVS